MRHVPEGPPRVLIISPVHNEAAHLAQVIDGVRRQFRPPDRWVIADDGSTDGTAELARRLTKDLPFVEVVDVPQDRAAADPLSEALEAKAFNWALAREDLGTFSYIGKLDGDVVLPADWYGVLLERMGADPSLGITGGTLFERRGDRDERLTIPRHHVHGALKLYSALCFRSIGGIQERLGWDTIDETYARMHGFTTRSFEDLLGQHMRPWASASGRLRGRARHGQCARILHYPVAWVLLRALKVAMMEPRVLSGLAYVWGYLRARAQGHEPVADPAFRAFTRTELRRRVSDALDAASAGALRRRPRHATT